MLVGFKLTTQLYNPAMISSTGTRLNRTPATLTIIGIKNDSTATANRMAATISTKPTADGLDFTGFKASGANEIRGTKVMLQQL